MVAAFEVPDSGTPASVNPAEMHVVHFAWRPPGASAAAYGMRAEDDQHQLVMIGVVAEGRYPVLIALHGQPKAGQNPRDYSFPQKVIEVTSDLVRRGQVQPLVLALPVFRYRGVNWPAFDLVAFRAQVEEVMEAQRIHSSGFYVVGHSAASGCGGDGMNRAHRIHPVAVGFFDTCLGSDWRDEVRMLGRARVPTLMIHSVETAGVLPREAREYSAVFDFGRVYRSVGLAPGECPEHLPDAPLRSLRYRCAADAEGVVRALVVDTGEGEQAHNAVIPVALAYFLREYLPAEQKPK